MELMEILKFLSTLKIETLIGISVIASVGYTIFSQIRNPKLYQESTKVHYKYEKIFKSYIKDSMNYILIRSVDVARKILYELPPLQNQP